MGPRTVAFVAILVTAACCKGTDSVDGTAVILVMDGVRVEESLGDEPSSATGEYPQEFMPETWSELLPQGVRASDSWSIGATTTTPAHAAIVTGRRMALANYPMNGDVGLYQPELPSLIQAAREQLEAEQEQVVVVANTELVHPIMDSLWPQSEGASWLWVPEAEDEDKPAQDDQAVIAALKTHMTENPTRLAVVNLHQVDRSGHYGANESYLDDVRDLDEPVVKLWEWIEDQVDYREDTYLWVLSDHGRHSYSQDEPLWRHHGCNCNGCRQVPSLLLGPGVAAGQDFHQPALLTDIAPSLAAALGVELPWAEGMVLDGLFEESTGVASRQGVADFAVSGGLVAEIRYLDDPAHRSELWIEGIRLSDADALAVEAPALVAAGDMAWLCFREVMLTPAEDDTNWTASCWSSTDGGGSWDALATPVDAVGPHWHPVLLVEDADSVLAAYTRNVNATATRGVEGGEGEVSLEVARLVDGDWTTSADDGQQTWPQDMVAALGSDERLYLAMGASTQDNEARHHRDVYTAAVSLEDEGLGWVQVHSAQLSSLTDTEHWRLELPALRSDAQGVLWLAAVAHDDAGAHAVLASSSDGGESWEGASILAMPDTVDPHLAPVWLEGRAVWGTTGDGESQLCAATTAGEVGCVSAGGARVQRLAADSDTLWALVDVDSASWELASWSASEL